MNSFLILSSLTFLTASVCIAEASSSTQCPVYATIPLFLFESNLNFNQHEWLRGIFDFKESESSLEGANFGLQNLQSRYAQPFFFSNRFTFKGNSSGPGLFDVTVSDLDLEISGQTSQGPVSYLVNFEAIQATFRIERVKEELEFTFFPPVSQIRRLQRTSGSAELPPNDFFTELVRRRFGLLKNEWTTYEWFPVLPYGSEFLGGIAFSLLKQFGLPQYNSESFAVICPQVQTQGPPLQYLDKQAMGNLLSDFREEESDTASVTVSSKGLQTFMNDLYEAAIAVDVPLPEELQTQALGVLRENGFSGFENAQKLGLKFFFENWGGDDQKGATVKIGKDGTLDMWLPFGITLRNIHENGHEDFTLLAKANTSIQFMDTARWLKSNGKNRLAVNPITLQIPRLQFLDSQGDVMNLESMKLLVGINLQLDKLIKGWAAIVQDFKRGYLDLGDHLGDIFMESPRDQAGFHWVRAYSDSQENQFYSAKFKFDFEEGLVDPMRYESSNRLVFKSQDALESIRHGYWNASRDITPCDERVLAPHVPVLKPWCEQDIEKTRDRFKEFHERTKSGDQCEKNMLDQCLKEWGCWHAEHFWVPTEAPKYNFELFGYTFHLRKFIRILAHVASAVALYAYFTFRSWERNEKK